MTGAVTASPLVLPAPQIEWSNLVAIFVLFGGAALSVLLEALVPRRARRSVQIALTILVLIAALVAVIVPWSRGDHLLAGEGALALDGPTCATWSMLMVFGLGTVLLFAERMGGAQTSFVANASSVPGSALERESEEARREHTEVFPLLLFCLFGMMLFAASNGLFHVRANLFAQHVVDFEHFQIGNVLLTLGTHKVVLKKVRLDALFAKRGLTT